MMPTKDLDIPFTEMEQFNFKQDYQFSFSSYQPNDGIFHSVVHVALKIPGDLNEHQDHQGYTISEKASTECIPDSLYMFHHLLFSGSSAFENNNETAIAEDKIKSITLTCWSRLSFCSKWWEKANTKTYWTRQHSTSSHKVKQIGQTFSQGRTCNEL